MQYESYRKNLNKITCYMMSAESKHSCIITTQSQKESKRSPVNIICWVPQAMSAWFIGRSPSCVSWLLQNKPTASCSVENSDSENAPIPWSGKSGSTLPLQIQLQPFASSGGFFYEWLSAMIGRHLHLCRCYGTTPPPPCFVGKGHFVVHFEWMMKRLEYR